MRLICPNCGAQYEVDDAVIPEGGRDVQCSNCGHTWFQQPAHMDADLADELGEDITPPDMEDDLPEEVDTASGAKPAMERQGLDPDIANLLREEAEHEAAQRRGDADGLETQPDLGLDEASDEAASRSAAARARMARLRGLDDPASDAETLAAMAKAAGSRRELLPDVEEINSSLRASADRDGEIGEEYAEQELEVPEKRKSGRLIFRLMLLVLVIGILVYVFAPQIVEFVPQTEPYLISYVDWANGLREQINGLVGTVVDRVKGLISSVTG